MSLNELTKYDRKLIFPILMVIFGILELYSTSQYVRNYDQQFQNLDIEVLKDMGITPNLNDYQEATIQRELSQVDFYNAIFMTITCFFLILWGMVRIEIHFIKRDL
jgi:hypothetical protein